jgi:hypothetical protein
MRFSLAVLTRRTRNPRRAQIVLRDIVPPATLATDLYRSVYLPVVQVWERAIPPFVAEYERTLAKMTADAYARRETSSVTTDSSGVRIRLTDSPDDLQARLDAASSEVERLFILLDAALRDWGVRVERWQREKWRGAVLSATGVDVATLIGPEDMRDTVSTYLRWNAALVRDVSAQARQRISNAVFAGLQNRTPVREVAKQISEATGMARDRSKRVAADQLNKITSALADERRREAGIDVWKWRHSGKRHPRETHLARNGKLYADTPAGADAEISAPPEDRPGQLPYCGCRAQAVLVLPQGSD